MAAFYEEMMDDKIRILFLSANPFPTGRIRVDEEIREIFEKLEEGPDRRAFELFKYPALRAADLQRLLMKHKPHIVHFSGHASLREKLILEGAPGRGKQVKIEALVEVFRLFKKDVRIVVLNACLTKPQALALTEVIDYAVGIGKSIGDKAAVTFAGAFYRALSFGFTVQEAFASANAELKMQDVRGSKGIELLTRKGVDQSMPFPPRVAADSEEPRDTLKEALRQLLAGAAKAEDKNRLRRALLDGDLILECADDTAEQQPRIFETSGVSGSGKALRAAVDPATYRRTQEQLFPAVPGIGPPLPGLMFIGRENSLSEVRALLQSTNPKDEELNLTVVRGWPGVGKTTLVGVLGRDPDVLQAFPDGVLWTALEREPELMTKLAIWGRTLGTADLLRTPTLDEAIGELAALIKHRRMLLIVDDIWDAAHALPFIKAAMYSKCAVLATTRLPKVAEALTADEHKIYNLPVLTEGNSLILLRYLAPTAVEQHQEECRELVADLGYLPLALHVAGRLLKTEAKIGLSVTDLIAAIRTGGNVLDAPAPIDRAEGTVLPTVQALLKKSTDTLDEQTRRCFAYLGAFAPKPATFDPKAMKAVWQVDDTAPIIRRLVGHGLLEPVGVARFQMHELLVSHARSLLR